MPIYNINAIKKKNTPQIKYFFHFCLTLVVMYFSTFFGYGFFGISGQYRIP